MSIRKSSNLSINGGYSPPPAGNMAFHHILFDQLLIEDEKYKSLIFEEYRKCPFYGCRKITKALCIKC